VHEDAGRVEHRPEAAGGRRQGGEDGADGVGRRDLARADPLLHPLDHALHQAAAQPLPRRRELRVGEQRIGARHLPARVVDHRWAA
jgi:hypothetical protein